MGECLQLGGDRAIEQVVGDVELVQVGEVQQRDGTGELVVLEEQSSESGQIVEGRWERAGEVVEAQVEANEVG